MHITFGVKEKLCAPWKKRLLVLKGNWKEVVHAGQIPALKRNRAQNSPLASDVLGDGYLPGRGPLGISSSATVEWEITITTNQ